MQKRLECVIEKIRQTKSFDDLKTCILGLRDHFEIDNLVYHSLNSTGQQYAVLTYADSWVDHYIEQDYARIDPVVLGCLQRFQPVEWKQLDWSGKAARNFMGEAIGAGVGTQGYSVPIRGPNGQFALFSVNHTCSDAAWSKFTERNMNDLWLTSHFINQRALDLEQAQKPEYEKFYGKFLSPRETDTLTLLAQGFSRAQVAEKLKISENTLRTYIESSRSKLRALNTTHAVASAMTRGLLLL